MTETMCTSGSVRLKAGVRVSSDLTAANYTEFINQAESHINAAARIDFTASYSGLTDAKKKILEDVASSLAAVAAINYDMSGFTSRAEAITMLNVNRDISSKGLRLIRDKLNSDFINEA